MAPALKGVLTGALVAGAAAAFVVAVHAMDEGRRLPVRVVSPASASAPASTNQPGPKASTGGGGASTGVRPAGAQTLPGHAHPSAVAGTDTTTGTHDAQAQPRRTDTTADPSTADPSTADPSTADPSTADPSTADPSGVQSSSDLYPAGSQELGAPDGAAGE